MLRSNNNRCNRNLLAQLMIPDPSYLSIFSIVSHVARKTKFMRSRIVVRARLLSRACSIYNALVIVYRA